MVLSIALIGGCAQRRTLSDEELAQVFHDAFLANAYTTTKGLNLDSLRLYEPIFNNYGYSVEDVQYTIGTFSTRKSARLSDVVERAIQMLEQKGESLDWEVSVLDSLDQITMRRTECIILERDEIEMRGLRDTVKVKFIFENMQSGNYQLSFRYLIDAKDTSPKTYRTAKWQEKTDTTGVSKGKRTPDKRFRESTTVMSRNKISNHSSDFFVDKDANRMVIYLARPAESKGVPHVTIKDLKIRRILSQEQAYDSIYRRLLPIKIFDEELLFPPKKDSL